MNALRAAWQANRDSVDLFVEKMVDMSAANPHWLNNLSWTEQFERATLVQQLLIDYKLSAARRVCGIWHDLPNTVLFSHEPKTPYLQEGA